MDYIKTLDGVKVAIINKSDLGVLSDVHSLVSSFDHVIPFSAKDGSGFDILERTVENIYVDNELDMGQSAIIANARQNAAVLSAAEALECAISSIGGDHPLEICCVQVENALSALGELDGRTVS